MDNDRNNCVSIFIDWIWTISDIRIDNDRSIKLIGKVEQKMIRTLEEQKEYVRACIGKEMANLMLAQNNDQKSTANENLDYLYGILESLEDRR